MPRPTQRTLDLGQLLEMAWRRRFTGLLVFVLPFAALVTAIVTLPDVYSANATILIERQQVPENFVRSTVTSSVESRVQIITQALMSRSQLTEIIEKFGLYQEMRAKLPVDEVVDQMRSDIRVGFGDAKQNKRTSSDKLGMTTAFTVEYLGEDPRKVSLVANELANRYINEDLKMRERHAEGTAKFLETELEQQLRQKLEEQEKKVAKFKAEHMGELPSQESANLSTLERLSSQLLTSSEKEGQVREQIAFLERQLAQSGQSPDSANPDAITLRLVELRRELTELRKRYTDKYPDVVQVTSEIARLQKELETRPPGEDSGDDSGNKASVAAPGSFDLAKNLESARAELRTLQAEQRNLKTAIAEYQQRVENTPKREQEFTAIGRDYATLQQVYDSLLKRYEEAKLAQSLEESQKGEQFRIRDYALVPETPVAPKRPRALLVSLVLSLALAGGAMLLREQFDTSFHSADEVRLAYDPPAIITIHRVITDGDRRRERVRLWGTAVSAVVVLGVAVTASYFLARGNSWLVSLLA